MYFFNILQRKKILKKYKIISESSNNEEIRRYLILNG